MTGLFAAGLILLALAAAADLFSPVRGWAPYLAGAAGSACLAVLGGFALAGRDVRLDVAGWLGVPVPGPPGRTRPARPGPPARPRRPGRAPSPVRG